MEAQQDSMKVEDAILKDANEKIQAASKNKGFKEVSVVYVMIEAAQKEIRSAKTGLLQTKQKRQFLVRHSLARQKLRNYEDSLKVHLPFKSEYLQL